MPSTCSQPNVVNLLSDTITTAGEDMRREMAKAEVGDDVFRTDPTTAKLEAKVAKMLGKQAALFVPSGTMGNLLCVMSHTWGRGMEILVGDKSHIYIYEQGNVAQFGGVHSRSLPNLPDGTFCLDGLKENFRRDDIHEPKTALVCIENTQNKSGGKALPMEWIREVADICRSRNLPLHCDGARLFNAAAALDVPIASLVDGCDSVSICLSKSLGAPVGSMIAGKSIFIERCRRLRKALGGGMRQTGHLAAAAIYALDNNVQRLNVDHQRVKRLAKVVDDHGLGFFRSDLDPVYSTNLLFVDVDPRVATAQEFVDRMNEVTPAEASALGLPGTSVVGAPFSRSRARFVPHLNVDEGMIAMAEGKMVYVMKEMVEAAGLMGKKA